MVSLTKRQQKEIDTSGDDLQIRKYISFRKRNKRKKNTPGANLEKIIRFRWFNRKGINTTGDIPRDSGGAE